MHPHRPVRLDVSVGGAAALVLALDTPAPFVGPDDTLPVGPRPLGERACEEHLARWEAMRVAGDIEALWDL